MAEWELVAVSGSSWLSVGARGCQWELVAVSGSLWLSVGACGCQWELVAVSGCHMCHGTKSHKQRAIMTATKQAHNTKNVGGLGYVPLLC